MIRAPKKIPSRPHIIGLTGSIGMGKSTVAAIIRDEGVPVFDADAEVRRLQGRGGALIAPIEAAFPGSTNAQGVDRAKLGALVFGDEAALTRLENIVHPMISEARGAFLDRHYDSPLICFDIPLLFEKGSDKLVDSVVVVSAPYEIQRERVLARPGMTKKKFNEINDIQTPDVEKRARADYVIDTSGSLDATKSQVLCILSCLRGQAAP